MRLLKVIYLYSNNHINSFEAYSPANDLFILRLMVHKPPSAMEYNLKSIIKSLMNFVMKSFLNT